MGRAIEVVAGFATNPGATLTSITPSTGLSTIVRGTDSTKPAWLLSTWAFCATAGAMRITSPRLHDQVQGMRWQIPAASVNPKYPGPVNGSFGQRLYAQDNLTVQISGGGAELDCAALLIGYDDLPGVAGRFIDHTTIRRAGINVLTCEVTVTAGTAGSFAGGVAINSSFDTLIANTDYAVMGGIANVRGAVARISGVDFGNLGLGFPADPALEFQTNNWFDQLSLAYNAPYIPVFNSANKAGIIVDVQTNGAGGTYIIDLNLVQLTPGTVPAAVGGTQAGTQPGQ